MLIQPDKNQLGDKALNASEALTKAEEKTRAQLEAQRIEGQDILENLEMSLGSPMPYQELIRRLQVLNSDLIFDEGGWRDNISIKVAVRTENGIEKKGLAAGFKKIVLPEFDYSPPREDLGMRARDYVRGWRTVVERLIQTGHISRAQANKMFGEALGQRSERLKRNFK